jgi:hypothetical protein
MAERYGAELSVPDWHKRLVCSACGSRHVDFIVTGEYPFPRPGSRSPVPRKLAARRSSGVPCRPGDAGRCNELF